jgi:hypothetical protein
MTRKIKLEEFFDKFVYNQLAMASGIDGHKILFVTINILTLKPTFKIVYEDFNSGVTTRFELDSLEVALNKYNEMEV